MGRSVNAKRVEEYLLPIIKPENAEPGQWEAGIGWK